VDAVAPHADVDLPFVGLDAVVGGVEDVVAENVDVVSRRRDPIGDTGDAVVGDRVVVRATRGERPVQLDPFAVEAPAGGVLIPDDRVVRDIPAFATALEIDVVVIVLEEPLPPPDPGSTWKRRPRVGNVGNGRVATVTISRPRAPPSGSDSSSMTL
jgi:hypothetical protein